MVLQSCYGFYREGHRLKLAKVRVGIRERTGISSPPSICPGRAMYTAFSSLSHDMSLFWQYTANQEAHLSLAGQDFHSYNHTYITKLIQPFITQDVKLISCFLIVSIYYVVWHRLLSGRVFWGFTGCLLEAVKRLSLIWDIQVLNTHTAHKSSS